MYKSRVLQENALQQKISFNKFIKKYQNYENFDRTKVIVLFNKIVNEILDLNLKRKRVFKFKFNIIQGFEIIKQKFQKLIIKSLRKYTNKLNKT